MAELCVIQVPYMLGDERQGGSQGPARLVQAGACEVITAKGITVQVECVDRGSPFRDSVSASFAVNQELAAVVRQATAAGQVPLVLAGSCDVCIGISSALGSARTGVVWFDAHGDFNTPETTITGFYGGMSLAVMTGHCYPHLRARLGNHPPFPESTVLMLGVRDLDPLEQERLERSAIQIVPWQDGKPLGDVDTALDQLARRVQEVYVHIDLDALDPQFAPAIVDAPVPGGLTLYQLEETIRAMARRFCLTAAALTTYNPDLDRNDHTLRAGLRVIEVLAEWLVQSG